MGGLIGRDESKRDGGECAVDRGRRAGAHGIAISSL